MSIRLAYRDMYESMGFSREEAEKLIQGIPEIEFGASTSSMKRQTENTTRTRGPDKKPRKGRADAGKPRKRSEATVSASGDEVMQVDAGYIAASDSSDSSSETTADDSETEAEPTLSRHARRRQALEKVWEDVRSPLFERYVAGKRRTLPLASYTHTNTCGYCDDLMEDVVAVQRVSIDGVTDCSIVTRRCEHVLPSDPIDMLSIGLFPNSPTKWNLFYEFRLMVFMSKLINHSPTSSTSVLASVLSSLGKTSIRKDELNTCIAQWRLLEVEEMKVVRGDLFACPSWPGGGHCYHIDGNFKLYRYEHPGSSTADLDVLRQQGFIQSDELVENYVRQTRKFSETDNVCGGTWKAAANQPGRKSSRIDETGLDIVSCRHDVALSAINMHRGEIFAYPLFLQLQFPDAAFVALDVVCKYWPWLSRQPEHANLAVSQRPLLSIMHGFSHAWKCQYKWGARRQLGAGLSTGETTKHVNGYLSRYGLTIRHMTKTRRHNRLTEAAAHWNRGKVAGLPQQLLTMKKKAQLKIRQMEAVDSWTELEEKSSRLSIISDTSDPLMAAVEVASANCLRLGQRVLKDGDSAKSRSRLRAKLRKAEQSLKGVISKLTASHPQYDPDKVHECCRTGVFPWMKSGLTDETFDDCCEAMEMVDLRKRAHEELNIIKVEHAAATTHFTTLRDCPVVVPDHLQVTEESTRKPMLLH